MKKTLFGVAALLICGAAGAQVFKCEVEGKVTLTDRPCAADAVRVKGLPSHPPPVTKAAPATPSRARPAPNPVVEVSARPGLPPGSCPTETDIKNIHTRLNAKIVPAKNVSALHNELDKAERCPHGSRRYSHEDWKRLEAVLRGDD